MDIVLDTPLSVGFQVAPREAEMALLESARAMNRDALVEIFDTYSPALYSYAFRLCSDSLLADYVVGDVFAKLVEQFSMGRGPNINLRSYLYEMTYHVIVDQARTAHREVTLESAEFLYHEPYSAFTTLENQVLLETIMRAMRNELTELQRHVIVLRFMEGFSLRETATIVKKEVNYVKVIQNRAITILRKVLDYKVTE
jgi:RNA polymerase sigma-70 factor (ECF subfamily)